MRTHICLLLFAFSATVSAAESVANTTRIVISAPEKVADGWVSTNGKASFSEPVLHSHGRAWSAYDHVLIRFDMQAIKAERFGRVKKATLRLHALEGANAQKKVTKVAPASTAWNSKATTASPTGDKEQWPSRNGHANINHTMIEAHESRRIIEKPGPVEFDITETVERWLYQGLPNHGLMVSTSPPIFGRPNAGRWTLSFASSEAKDGKGPALIVEMEGRPPTPEQAHSRALALYPSALLPPVSNPCLIVWYGVSREVCRQLPAANVTTYRGLGNWFSARGGIDLGWAEGGPSPWLDSEKKWVDYYRALSQRTLGYCMHEWHIPPQRRPWAVAAVREAEKQHPHCFSAFFYQGQRSMADLAAEGVLDLLIQEGYTNVRSQFPREHFAIGMDGIKRQIDVAREAGAIEQIVIMLGHIAKFEDYHKGHELTAEIVDRQIKELRAYAPEMPGIGFYYAGGEKLAVQCDALARKHFIEPAPELLIAEPRFEETLTTPHITIRAKAEAKGNRQIVRYRWFIDNRLVAETKQPQYVWDLRGEQPGQHFVTVHVVDNAWNRAATQIPLRISPR